MHIVLYEPDIPFNTGNVGRSCLATGSTLHLVGRLGFSLNQKEVRRAGLDYWTSVDLRVHEDWDHFLSEIGPAAPLYFFSKKADNDFWDARYVSNSYLVFGCETKGLPDSMLERYKDKTYRIPMRENSVRSLNLSTAAGVVLYEALRQTKVLNVAPEMCNRGPIL